MTVLILSHERSTNKAEGFLHAYGDNCTLVVDYMPDTDEKPYIAYINNIIVDKYFDIVNITNQVKTVEKIWCVSENLLPLQAQLESYYGIQNLTPYAAEVLSNKQRFDDYCRSIGLEDFVPESITPTFHNHLSKFKNKEIFSKPDIGTGSNVFFPGDNQNTPSIEYRRWNNRHHFLKYIKDKKIHNKFFELNQSGIYSDRFAFKQCKIMFQEYFWSEKPTVAPYGYIHNGKVNILFYVNCSKINFGETVDPLSDPIESHTTSRTSDIGRERAVWISMPDEIDSDFHKKSLYFLQTITDKLKIKNLFFAGPDFHVIDKETKAIDFNPRPGQFINVLNRINNHTIIDNMLLGKQVVINKKAMYACPILKPGIINEVKNLETIKPWLTDDHTKLQKGVVIPEFQHLFNKAFNLTLYIDGKNEQELFERYKKLNQLLQECIIY